MKQITSIWVSLTLLMLMLVLVATVIFLYPSWNRQRIARTDLQYVVGTRESELAAVGESQATLQLQLTQQAGPLADYHATQTAVAVTAIEGDLTITNTTIVTPTKAETVTISLSTPDDDLADLNPGDTISITAEITDDVGLVELSLFVNNETVDTLAVEDKMAFIYQTDWVAPFPGRFVLAVGVKNKEEQVYNSQHIVILVKTNEVESNEDN